MKGKGIEIYNPFKMLLQLKDEIASSEKKKAKSEQTKKDKK